MIMAVRKERKTDMVRVRRDAGLPDKEKEGQDFFAYKRREK